MNEPASIIKKKAKTVSAMDSILPRSERHAALWICSDGPKEQQSVVNVTCFRGVCPGKFF